jgi:hypothetical protein
MNQKLTTRRGKIHLHFDGFESLHDLEEEVLWAVEHFEFPEAEWKGTLMITIEYFEDKE